MIQIIPHEPGALEMFGAGFSEGLTGSIERYQKQKSEKKVREEKSSKIKQFLDNNPDLPPETRSILQGVGDEIIPEQFGSALLKSIQAQKSQAALDKLLAPFMSEQNQSPMDEAMQPAQGLQGTELSGGQMGGGQAPQQTIEQPSPQPAPQRREITPELIQKVAAIDPKRAELLQKERSAQLKAGTAREAQLLPIQKEAQEHLTKANNSINALNTQLAVVKSGQADVLSKANFSNWLQRHGYETAANAVQSAGGKAFLTGAKQQFGGAKEIFGAKISNYEAGIFDQMMAHVGTSKEANELAIKSLMVAPLAEQERNRYKLQLIEADPNLSPIRLNNAVFRHMEEYENDLYTDWQDTLYKALGATGEKPKGKPQEPRPSLDEIFGPSPV